MYGASPEKFTLPLIGDLLITAPLAYWLVARTQKVSFYSVARIALIGLLIATFLLTGRARTVVLEWRRWLAPIAEIGVIGYIVWRFVGANRKEKESGGPKPDFLFTTRQVLTELTGSVRAANILASEVAVFHYVFARGEVRPADNTTTFSNFRKSGIFMVLYAFLGIFLIETLGMHFLLSIWSRAAAWTITVLSIYSCLQLLGHIRAMRARPVRLDEHALVIRHGLMGGDVTIPYDLISSVALAGRIAPKDNHLKVALIKGMEKHTIELRTISRVRVIRAFGILKDTDHLLLCVDEPAAFLEKLNERINKNA